MLAGRYRLHDRTRRRFEKTLFVVPGLALLLMSARLLSQFAQDLRLLPDFPLGIQALLAGIALYLCAHFLRVARLSLLIENASIGLRQICLVHLYTAAVSLILPFKLGEAYRVAELGILLRQSGRALLLVWIERAFDIGLICLMLLFTAFFHPAAMDMMQPLIVISLAFTFTTLVAFGVLPENLRRLTLYVIRRYNSDRALSVLRLIDAIQGFIDQGRRLVRGKVLTVFAMSLGIWILELQVFATFLSAVDLPIKSLVAGLQVYLSNVSLSGGYGLLHAAGAGQSLAGMAPALTMAGAATYHFVVTIPLFLVGTAAAMIYARTRLLDAGSASGAGSMQGHPGKLLPWLK